MVSKDDLWIAETFLNDPGDAVIVQVDSKEDLPEAIAYIKFIMDYKRRDARLTIETKDRLIYNDKFMFSFIPLDDKDCDNKLCELIEEYPVVYAGMQKAG
jgi:hypothetical protein